MNLNEWAIKWGIPFNAVEDLRAQLGMVPAFDPAAQTGESEAAVQTRIRLEASKKFGRLWRNNVGGMYDANQNFIRYGLANDSKRMNASIKSSDLIGLRAVRITETHVGSVIGQFIARECKPANWGYTGTVREQAQLQFINLVLAMGGDAQFATGEGTL